MKISTRGRYALRFMIDLAEHSNGNYIPLKDIAKRQEISLKYLEGIAKDLSYSQLIEAQHGKGGGYKLAKDASKYTVFEVLDVTEKDVAPVSCLEKNAPICPRVNVCKTISVWKGLEDVIKTYLSGINLSDLCSKIPAEDWVI